MWHLTGNKIQFNIQNLGSVYIVYFEKIAFAQKAALIQSITVKCDITI